ncbi:MAG: isoleucine--tRNA ligase [Puniceicoccales bacterium]|jgi:isoleucyl-tRNA synthetase|nr:isoleucine--tRNA ligase [Puniceicoccales bacterium]
MAVELKDTLNLPVTNFPMRANLTGREPGRIDHWEKIGLYARIQEINAGKPAYVLHDGPPFTNGDVHIGTALNKLLKDIILRYKTMRGLRTPFVPGWDCHGLPIEHKVMKDLQAQKKELDALEIRKACADFSESYMNKQRRQFRRLGVLADWAAEYKTMAPGYEADILRTFAAIVEQNLVYRSKKPVYWSIPCATALAEAEIEYKEKKSPSIWVAFEVVPHPEHMLDRVTTKQCTSEDGKTYFEERILNGNPFIGRSNDGKFFFVIWTTTPWTLPANRAIAVHPKLEYVEVRCGQKVFIVADELADQFIEVLRKDSYVPDNYKNRISRIPGKYHRGKDLEGVQTAHPFLNRQYSPVVLAEYVTTDAGTGCVHTAPGHGLEDYQTGLKYDLDIYSPVNDQGVYVDDGQMPENLVGVSVLETDGKCPANIAVLEMLKKRDSLLKLEFIHHQYPHCWRSKTPVIFRAVSQWFVGLERDISPNKKLMRDKMKDLSDADFEAIYKATKYSARLAALDAIGTVKWTPEWGENRIRAAVENRPDWCISRQRSWGVPIPAFYDAENNAYLDAGVIKAVAEKVQTAGTNLWFEKSSEEILNGVALPAGWPTADKLKKGSDTLDVWIDSGTSHIACLTRNPELHWPADLYLEGSDQHRGWFQSSLWTGIVAKGAAPYKHVITHGFVVNEKRQKISKSDGKPQTADDYVNKYGADIVRLWIASENYQNDIPLSDAIFDSISNQYRSVRNTFRYQLSNLYDFDAKKDAVPVADMTLIDKWALHKLHALVVDVTAAFDSFEFHKAHALLAAFTTNTLSATYHNILKDRLYTLAPAARERRSSQTAIRIIYATLLRLFAPVLPFTTDESWGYFNADAEYIEDSIHLQKWPEADASWKNDAAASEFETLLSVLDKVNVGLEALRQSKTIGQSLDAQVLVFGDPAEPEYALLMRNEDILAETFIVSDVRLIHGAGTELRVETLKAEGVRCPRSWRWVPQLVNAGEFGMVSPRCRDALAAKYSRTF